MSDKKEIQLTGGFSLTPKTLDEAMALSKLMADSDLVPKDYKGKAGNVLIAVQMGAEVGLPPMQAMQAIAVINGKPSLYGDVGKALLRSRGCDIIENSDEDRKATGVAKCKIRRKGQEDVEKTFSIDNAKTAKLWGKMGPWTEYPYNQLGWRAFWFAARAAAADILKGLSGREEVQDYPNAVDTDAVVIPPPQRVSQIAAQADAAPTPAVNVPPVNEEPPAPSTPPTPAVAKTNTGEEEVTIQIDKIDYREVAPSKFEYTIVDVEGVTYHTTEKLLAKRIKAASETKEAIRLVWRNVQVDLAIPPVRTLVSVGA